MSRRRHQKQRPNKPPEKAPPEHGKIRTWTLPTILGIALGVVGSVGIIELRPQLNVTPQEQLATGEPFSAPFQITNTGYLSLHVENVTVVWPRVEYGPSLTFDNASTNNASWDNFDLERGGSTTILPRFANGMPTKADIVIAVDYKYFGVRERWLFRFEGTHIDKWQWSKQPVGNRKAEFNKAVDYSLSQHRKFNPSK